MVSLRYSLFPAFAAVFLFAGSPVSAQGVKERLFAPAMATRQAANEHDAAVLAPSAYGKGMRYYRSAEKRFSEARSIDSVQKDLEKAINAFRQAEMVAELAEQQLATLIKARADALTVEASQYSAREWKRAESLFRSAISNNESGRARDADRAATSATSLYREAELTAIKTMYLAETELLIVQAEKSGAKKHAPETLANAKMLLQSAEVELTNNRYDIDKPRSLARQAMYEARHAIHLTEYLADAKAKRRSPESLILEWEKPLQEIAASADINAEFDQGYDAPMRAVIEYLEDQRADARELGQQVADRDAELATLGQEIGRLQEELGGVADEQAFLQQRLMAQEALRQQVKQIESTFERAEAEVFRDSNEIYIRLVGLSFESGSAAIEAENFDILRKVEDAIRVFDDSQVIIEGHTDSYGSDEENLSLSELRATSVREYLMVKMGLQSERVSAVGYGESRPVANNETPQGRAKNRRIDVRIVPDTVGGVDLAQATF